MKIIEDDFVGLDFTTTDLKKPAEFLKAAQNATYVETSGIQKRAGFEVIGGVGLHLGIDNYVYLDKTTGETKEELLGFGCHLFRFTECNLTISRTSGTFSIEKQTSGEDISILFYPNGGILPEYTYTYTESESSQNYPIGTIGDLCLGLLGTGFYIVSLSKPGTVLTATGTNMPSGIGPLTLEFNANIGTMQVGRKYTAYNRETGFLEYFLASRDVSGDIELVRNIKCTYDENDPIGSCVGFLSSANFDTAGSPSASHIIPFYFWDGVPSGIHADRQDNVITLPSSTFAGIFESVLFGYTGLLENYSGISTGQIPSVQGLNLNDKNYFALPYFDNYQSPGFVNAEVNPPGQLLSYDKEATYRAGLPRPNTISGFSPSSISPHNANGNFSYFWTYIYYDDNGVEWESVPSTVQTNNTGGTGGGTTITINPLPVAWLDCGLELYDVRGVVFTTTQTGTVLNVRGALTGTYPNVTIGDTIYTSPTVSRKILDIDFTVSPSTITIDNSLSVVAGQRASTGFFIRIYRTKQFGQIFYKQSEHPIYKTQLVVTVDTTSDSNLTIEYIEPLPGEEHEPTPIIGKICSHQGNLVSLGSNIEPNTVYWSGIDGVEYFPRAFNSIDVPSTIVGNLTAGVSDNDNSLALFKDRAYYSLDGDLATKAVSVRVIKEGDYGISSQRSIAKVDGVIMGMGSNGVVGVLGGVLDSKSVGNISPVIRGRSDLDYQRATGINDYINSQYILSIPTIVQSGAYSLGRASETFVLNYERGKWLQWNTGTSNLDLTGGMVMHKGQLYGISRCGTKEPNSPSVITYNNFKTLLGSGNAIRLKKRTDALPFNDTGLAIPFRLFTSFDSLGEPSMFKLFQKILIWRVPADYLTGSAYVPVDTTAIGESIQISCYMDWVTNSSYPQAKHSTITAIFDTLPFVELNIRDQRARSIAVEVRNEGINENIFISGIEIIYDAQFGTDGKRAGVAPRGAPVSSGGGGGGNSF